MTRDPRHRAGPGVRVARGLRAADDDAWPSLDHPRSGREGGIRLTSCGAVRAELVRAGSARALRRLQLESRFIAARRQAMRRRVPPTGLALTVLEDPHWSAVTARGTASLLAARTVGSGNLLDAPLHLDERILEFVLGVSAFDERLRRWSAPSRLAAPASSAQPAVAPLRSAHGTGRAQGQLPREPLLLIGRHRFTRRERLRPDLPRGGSAALRSRRRRHPARGAEREQLARRWTREAMLSGAALYLRTEDCESVRNLAGMARDCAARRWRSRSAGQPGRAARRAPPAPRSDHRAAASARTVERGTSARWPSEWTASWTGSPSTSSSTSPRSGWSPRRSGRRRAAAMDADAGRAVLARLPGARPPVARDPRPADRRRGRLGRPGAARAAGARRCARSSSTCAGARVVNHRWGFAGKHARGLGLTVLFAGASGTGKTMAAEILAAELDLDLYRVDLAAVVSKYIGETEKNLRAIFDAAERRAARSCSSTRPTRCSASAARCATATTATPTSRSATCCSGWRPTAGIAILTTNMQHALDPAFMRRIRFVVQFPFPDARRAGEHLAAASSRRTRRSATSTSSVLAQLNVSGGVIRNIATGRGVPRRRRLGGGRSPGTSSTRRAPSTRKLDKPLTPAETRGPGRESRSRHRWTRASGGTVADRPAHQRRRSGTSIGRITCTLAAHRAGS